MKPLKCLLAVLVAGIVLNALDFLVQGKLLTEAYYSKMDSMKQDTPVYWYVILDFVAVLVFACVYKRVASVFADGTKGGVCAGFMFGVLVCFPGYLFMFLMTKGYPQSLAWINIGYGIVWYMIAGAIVGAMRGKPAPTTQPVT